MKLVTMFAALVFAGAFVAAHSQEAGISSPPPAWGDKTYQQFGLWQKFQLGATSLVNPKAAERAMIVYGYKPSQIADVQKLLTSKQVLVVTPTMGSDNNWQPMSAEEARKLLTTGSPADADKQVRVLSTESLSDKVDTKFIGWSD